MFIIARWTIMLIGIRISIVNERGKRVRRKKERKKQRERERERYKRKKKKKNIESEDGMSKE